MRRATAVLRGGRKALKDFDLCNVLQSEINHELSSDSYQVNPVGSLGDFVVDWDSHQSQDVVLRRKSEMGEEVVVSAVLGPLTLENDGLYPWDISMKVCVKRPCLKSILKFDCRVSDKDTDGSKFDIQSAHYLQPSAVMNLSAYRGPLFSSLDPRLQDTLKEYLVSRGITQDLTSFLLLHLHRKEKGQYVDWLQKLESFCCKK